MRKFLTLLIALSFSYVSLVTEIAKAEATATGGAYTPTVVTAVSTGGTTGIQNNGANASQKQSNGGNAAMIAAALMAATAAATCPACQTRGTCPICIAAMLGAAAAALTAGKMKDAENKSNTQITDVNPTKPGALTPVNQAARNESPEQTAERINKSTGASGPKLSKDLSKLKLKDGREINVGSAVSAAGGGGGSGGLKGGELSALKDALKQAKDAALKAAKDGEQSGDSNAYVSGKPGSSSDAPTSTAVASAGFAANRDPASVTGAFKDHNGDKIGVASDSMFIMINRRYNLKGVSNAFSE
jgi:hypothetical protein